MNSEKLISVTYGEIPIKAIIYNGKTIWKIPQFSTEEVEVKIEDIKSYYAEVGDILFVDKNNKRMILSKDSDLNHLKNSGYRPIGLVCVPGKFNIYGDCSVSCIALNYISEKNPELGAYVEDETILFNTIDTGRYDYGDEFNSGNGLAMDDNLSNSVTKFLDQPMIPTDYWIDGEEDYVPSADGIGYYLRWGVGNNNTDKRGYSPSPYLADQSQNPIWWYSTKDLRVPLQSYINGKELTDLYIAKYTLDDGRINAIRVIKDFNPFDSDTKGDWYLGAPGEMAIMATRVRVLNSVISKIKSVFGFETASYIQNASLLTSAMRYDTTNTNIRIKCIGMKSVVISNEDSAKGYYKPLIRIDNVKDKVKVNINWDYIETINLNNHVYYKWNYIPFIEIPKGEKLNYSIVLKDNYSTNDKLKDEITVNNEITLGNLDIINIENNELIAGNIILANNINENLICLNPDNITEEIANDFTPIGIIVIPASHNAYDDDEFCIVGLRTISLETPEIGSVEDYEYMSFYKTSKTTTTVSNKNAAISSSPRSNDKHSEAINTKEFYIGTTKRGFTVQTYVPEEYCYESGYTQVTPYANGDKVNSPYFNGTSGTYASVVNKIVGRTSTTNFQTKEGDEPQPCWNVQYYKTLGTNEGDWFVNSFGELVYLVARLNEIQYASDKICKFWPEFKYNIIKDDETLVAIVKREDSNGSTKFYNIDLSICKSGFEDLGEYNKRIWLPYTRLFTSQITKGGE